MERIEVSVEVGPIDLGEVERIKAAGHAVYRGTRSWRVTVTAPVSGATSVRSQAHVLVHDLFLDFDLTPVSNPPAWTLRDPDADIDVATGQLLLADNQRAYDPDPIERPKRKWWQKQMELGLGERKGD